MLCLGLGKDVIFDFLLVEGCCFFLCYYVQEVYCEIYLGMILDCIVLVFIRVFELYIVRDFYVLVQSGQQLY